MTRDPTWLNRRTWAEADAIVWLENGWEARHPNHSDEADTMFIQPLIMIKTDDCATPDTVNGEGICGCVLSIRRLPGQVYSTPPTEAELDEWVADEISEWQLRETAWYRHHPERQELGIPATQPNIHQPFERLFLNPVRITYT